MVKMARQKVLMSKRAMVQVEMATSEML